MKRLAQLLVALAALALPGCVEQPARDGVVLDPAGGRVQLRGVNWFGFETEAHLVNGLWARRYTDLIADMRAQDINAVRLPLCSDTLHAAPVKAETLDAVLNPEFAGLDALAALDKIVAELDAQGLYILLDLHTPHCKDIPPLWHTTDYSEQQWLDDLALLAQRYGKTPRVIGVDLKNEPHGEASWGTGNTNTDWNLAAERGARAVLQAAPHWLVFVEGIEKNAKCSKDDPHFWGENLEPLACTPLDIPADRLVLAPHSYGPDVAKQPFFDDADFPRNLPKLWERRFGRYTRDGYTVIPGEFGGFYGEGDARDVAWQRAFVAWLNRKGIRSGFYWSLNPNSKDTGGLLREDWSTWRADKLALLHAFWEGSAAAFADEPTSFVPSPAATQATPEPTQKTPPAPTTPTEQPATPGPPAEQTPAPPSSPAQPTPPATAVEPSASGKAMRDFIVTRSVDSDWGKGYCLRYAIRNVGTTEGEWWVDVPADGRIGNLWKGQWKQAGDLIHVTGAEYNRSLKPGQSTDFGYCATRE